MKTIKELSEELSIDRSTLLKAAQDGRIPAHQSGATWIIHTEDEQYIQWLEAHMKRKGKTMHPETIQVETPPPPTWVKTEAGKRAWRESLSWRVNAASATGGPGVAQVRKMLLREAERMYTTNEG
jgi:excisionase family DNA binding protein